MELKIEKIVEREEAQKIMRKTLSLRIEGDGMVVTDFEKVYYADKKSAWDGEKHHPQAVWLHNQAWLIYETEENVEFPQWFDVEFARKVLSGCTEKGREACFVPGRNQYTSGYWYASNIRDAIWYASVRWSPLNTIDVYEKKLIFDNGESGFTGKPLQLWDDGSLSTFNSSKKQKYGQLSKAVETLLKFAIDDRKSTWCKDKKWQELLSFEGTISAFSKIADKHIVYFDAYENHDLSYAIATDSQGSEKYLLISWAWGCMGEDGDAGENLYLFERGNINNLDNLPRLIGLEEAKDD